MNDIILVFLLLSPLIVGVGIVWWKLEKSETTHAQTFGEAVQEFLGDEQVYEENVRVQQAQFPILYSKAQGALDIFTWKGYVEDAKEWARHMYRLGWLSGIDVYMIFSQYGNVFEEEQDGSEPIREYAIEVLNNLIESKEKEDIRQLVAEMQALGWFDASSEEYLYLFGRLCELGIDINNCYKE